MLIHMDRNTHYPASFIYRGNVTQANTPGKTINTTYDYTGTVVSQNDNNGHSVNVATSTATNYTVPDTLSPNGSTTLQTQAQYATTGYFPASVAGPNQSIYNPTSGIPRTIPWLGRPRHRHTRSPAHRLARCSPPTPTTNSTT
jgi:YD repeat-containing protein